MITFTVQLHPEHEGQPDRGSNDYEYAFRDFSSRALPRTGDILSIHGGLMVIRAAVTEVMHVLPENGESRIIVSVTIPDHVYDGETSNLQRYGWEFYDLEL